MGFGDEIIGTSFAKGARERGKRIAFGNGKRILWAHTGEVIYRGNPNIAMPGSEGAPDLEWISHYKHHRIYFTQNTQGSAWKYDPNFRVSPGELYFDKGEQEFANNITPGFILIEPKVKQVYANKQWPADRYELLAKHLIQTGYSVCQFIYDEQNPKAVIYPGVVPIVTRTIRQALAVLQRAKLFIGPEGGLAHGAAAVGLRSVVLFGGFTDPKILGYEGNRNLTGGATQACGSLARCQHCINAMNAISVSEVYQNVLELINGR